MLVLTGGAVVGTTGVGVLLEHAANITATKSSSPRTENSTHLLIFELLDVLDISLSFPKLHIDLLYLCTLRPLYFVNKYYF